MADENFEFPEFFVYRHLGLAGRNIGLWRSQNEKIILFTHHKSVH